MQQQQAVNHEQLAVPSGWDILDELEYTVVLLLLYGLEKLGGGQRVVEVGHQPPGPVECPLDGACVGSNSLLPQSQPITNGQLEGVSKAGYPCQVCFFTGYLQNRTDIIHFISEHIQSNNQNSNNLIAFLSFLNSFNLPSYCLHCLCRFHSTWGSQIPSGVYVFHQTPVFLCVFY